VVIISKVIIHAALKAMAANTIAISAVVVGTSIALFVDTFFAVVVISIVIIIAIAAASRCD